MNRSISRQRLTFGPIVNCPESLFPSTPQRFAKSPNNVGDPDRRRPTFVCHKMQKNLGDAAKNLKRNLVVDFLVERPAGLHRAAFAEFSAIAV